MCFRAGAYYAWRQERFDLLTSAHQLAEVEAVLARPRLQKYVSAEETWEMVRGLRAEAEQVDADRIEVARSPDPDDNRILAIALAGQADYVISGDRADMLSLGEIEGIPVITARQAVEILDLTSQP